MSDILKDMPQYHISRAMFETIVDKTIGYDRLWGLFDSNASSTVNFRWFRSDEEYYILHLPSGMMLNWYKHIGRTNTCSQPWRKARDYYAFFRRLMKECLAEGVIKVA